MKNYLVVVLVSCLLIVSCSDDDDPELFCNGQQKIEDSNWLTAEIESIMASDISQYFYISQAEYLLQTVILFDNCCPFCGTVIPVYDCQGELLGTLGNADDQINGAILTNTTVIWQPPSFACSF